MKLGLCKRTVANGAVQTQGRASSALWETLLYTDDIKILFFFSADEAFSFSSFSVSRSYVIFSVSFIQPFPRSFLRLWRVTCSLNCYSGFAALGGFGVSVLLLFFCIRQESKARQKWAGSSRVQTWDLGFSARVALSCSRTWGGLLSPRSVEQFRGETSGEAEEIEPGPFPSKPGLKCSGSLKSVLPRSRVQIEIQPVLCFDGPF